MSELEVEIESVRIALDNISNSNDCEYNRRQKKSLWRRLEQLQKALSTKKQQNLEKIVGSDDNSSANW